MGSCLGLSTMVGIGWWRSIIFNCLLPFFHPFSSEFIPLPLIWTKFSYATIYDIWIKLGRANRICPNTFELTSLLQSPPPADPQSLVTLLDTLQFEDIEKEYTFYPILAIMLDIQTSCVVVFGNKLSVRLFDLWLSNFPILYSIRVLELISEDPFSFTLGALQG